MGNTQVGSHAALGEVTSTNQRISDAMTQKGLKAPAALEYVRLSSKVAVPTFADFGCEVNSISAREIFAMYERVGFLYPQKKQLLGENLFLIEKNWAQAMTHDDPLLRIVTFKDSAGNVEASVMCWRTGGNDWIYQHLVANQNPLASWSVMQSSSTVTAFEGREQSKQNWYRPNNRYAHRLFGSLIHTVGAQYSTLIPYAYLKADRKHSNRGPMSCVIEHGVGPDREEELRDFVQRHKGSVFAQAEGINDNDWELSNIDRRYQNEGLFRRRHVVMALDSKLGHIIGVALTYRGPLGLNFSFLENRLDLILSDYHMAWHVDVARSLLDASLEYYSGFELDWIPVVVDPAAALNLAGVAIHLRDYNQVIWLHQGFEAQIAHYDKFYERLLTRRDRGAEIGHGEI
jgi:hypothetical protein